jgi:hypothetical protein
MSLRTYDFAIPIRLITLNELLRMHWSMRRKVANELAWEVRSQAMPPATPIRLCNVIIERTSTQEPDPDGKKSCAKLLLDILQPCSVKHPLGLGFIYEDSSACIKDLQVRHIHGTAKRTRIIIKELAA